MSVKATDSKSEIWLAWQGREINADLRLGRYLGGSDHSAVFLGDPAAVAVKLVPAWSALAESQLSDWKIAAGLAHPHLIRLLETGRCELDGQPCLYAVMEYADQNLAQLLRHRALSEAEVREVLPAALDALGYLHGRNLVQGQLKPANILAVGDRLKLATDTVHGVSETRGSRGEASVYDPPEAREGIYAAAGDVWGLGLTLVEALTCAQPEMVIEGRGGVVLPHNLPPAFGELVTWCLSRRPFDRPKVTEIEAWLRRQTVAAAPAGRPEPATIGQALKADRVPRPAEIAERPQKPATPAAQDPRLVATQPVGPNSAAPVIWKRRSFALSVIGAIVLLLLIWVGLRGPRAHRPAPSPAVAAARPAPASTPGGAPPAAAVRAPSAPAQITSAAAPAVLHAEIPNVPVHARHTIHGHIRVSVRVIVDKDGNVVAALEDRPGPSRYFARLALTASRKWTFSPADTQARRLYAVHFVFSRDATTGHADPIG